MLTETLLTVVFLIAGVLFTASVVVLARTKGQAQWARVVFWIMTPLYLALMVATNWSKGGARHWVAVIVLVGLVAFLLALVQHAVWSRRADRRGSGGHE